MFGIDATSGVLSTLVDTLDRDTATGGLAYYDVTVIATDGGTPAQSSTVVVRVGLTDDNDNTPVFAQNSYTLTIAESTAAGISLQTSETTVNRQKTCS